MNSTAIRFLFVSLVVQGWCGLVSAELLEFDDPRYGARALTLDTSTGLAWLDLPFTSGLSYQQVNAATQPGGAFAGFRFATLEDVSSLFEAARIPEAGFYAADSVEAGPILSLFSLVGAPVFHDGYPEIFMGVTGTQSGPKAHFITGFDFLYGNGNMPIYSVPSSRGFGWVDDSFVASARASWLVTPIPEPSLSQFGALIGLAMALRNWVASRHNQQARTSGMRPSNAAFPRTPATVASRRSP